MNQPPPRMSEWSKVHPPRCLSCGYVLTGLQDQRCPECGRDFNWHDPKSFTTKPPFLGWKFWLPGFLLAFGGAMVGAIFLYWGGNWGWSLWFAVPFAGGGLLGYRFRAKWWVLGILILGLVVALCVGAISMDIAGIFCGIVLAGLFLGPVLIGTVLGAILRLILKHTPFNQRWYLPAFALFLIPIICDLLEGRSPTHQPERISTSAIINASDTACWNAIVFYEEVTHEPPFILKIGLARPLRTIGESSMVGDVKVCVYNKGRITKEIIAVEQDRLLAFEVVEQNIGYEHDVKLLGGSFAFQPIDADHTRIVLTTDYTPLLTPRWAWRPFERYAVHTLHGHVIEGIRRRAESDESPQALAVGAAHAN